MAIPESVKSVIVFHYGCCLTEALFGQPPFASKSFNELEEKILSKDPIKVSKKKKNVWAHLHLASKTCAIFTPHTWLFPPLLLLASLNHKCSYWLAGWHRSMLTCLWAVSPRFESHPSYKLSSWCLACRGEASLFVPSLRWMLCQVSCLWMLKIPRCHSWSLAIYCRHPEQIWNSCSNLKGALLKRHSLTSWWCSHQLCAA